MEFISSLLGGTDTPDAPLEQKFEGLPSTAAEMTALAESTPLAAAAKIKSGAGDAQNHVAAGDVASGPYAQERAFLSLETSDMMNTLGPFLGDIIARNARAGGENKGLGGQFLRGQSPGASVAEALRRRARDIEEAEQRDQSLRHARHDVSRNVGAPASEKYDAARSRLRVHSAPEPSAGPTLSRMFENTETHLPAAAVRRTAERQEMQQFRNAHQAHQAHQAQAQVGARGADEGGSGPSVANGAEPAEKAAVKAESPESDPGLETPAGLVGAVADQTAGHTPSEKAPPHAVPVSGTPTPSTSQAKPPKTKNPKRADRRRTIARFTTAILRAGGSNAFIARDGLGYRKAFDRFLVETYGETFAEGGYWYENARVEPFFRVLFHVATDGRVRMDHDVVNALFCKREKRQAAEWLLDEEELSKFGVTATQLAQIFEGPPSVSPSGYPRGTPLAIPTDAELDSGAIPRKGAGAAAAAAAAAAQQQMMRHAPGAMHPGFGAPQPQRNIPVAMAVRGEERGGKDGSSGDANGSRGPDGVPHGGGRPYDASMAAAAAAVAAGGQAAGYSRSQIQYAQALARQQQSQGEFSGDPRHASNGHYHHHGPPGYHMGPMGPMAHGHPGYVQAPFGMFPPVSLNAQAYGPSANASAYGAGDGRGGVSNGQVPNGPNGPMDGSFQPHGRVPSFGYLDPVPLGSGPRRQYSSDLSRLMSEFNANPTSSDDFLKSFIQRSASELDILAALQSGPGNPQS